MSRIITQPDLDLTRGMLALSTIICFEATAGWLVMHGPLFAKIFQKQPVLLAFRGDIYDKQLMRYSVHIRKVYQALRGAGCNDPAQVCQSIYGTKRVPRLMLPHYVCNLHRQSV